MINDWLARFSSLFKSEEQPAAFQTPQHISVKFMLLHGTIAIGELTLDNGIWTFCYTEAFKAQDRLAPLIDFSNVDRVYKSHELFPYFAGRIPSLARPQIQRIIKKQNIDDRNTVALLKHFGQRTITTPFELVSL
jgi:HipA-like protein